MEQQLMSNKALMIKIILQFLFACLRFGGGFKHMTNYDSSIFFCLIFCFVGLFVMKTIILILGKETKCNYGSDGQFSIDSHRLAHIAVKLLVALDRRLVCLLMDNRQLLSLIQILLEVLLG